MRLLLLFVLGAAALLGAPVALIAQQRPDVAVVHEFVIPNFATESGVVLPEARVVYGVYGHLNGSL